MVIPNCGVTQQSSEILKECVLSKSNPLYKEYGGYHTGVDISGSNIYSLYDGTIALIGDDAKGHSVIIQTGSSLCICYRNLHTLSDIRAGMTISAGTYIGAVQHYVHVEALTQAKSLWPVRIGVSTWYKQDIMNYLTSYTPSNYDAIKFDLLGIKELSTYPSGDYDKIEGVTAYTLSNNGPEDE